jgi:hypothetical protein
LKITQNQNDNLKQNERTRKNPQKEERKKSHLFYRYSSFSKGMGVAVLC